MSFRDRLHARAAAAQRHVALPEGDEPRTLQAAVLAARRGLARITLLGDPGRIRAQAAALGADLGGVTVAAPGGDAPAREAALRAYLENVRRKGVTADEARRHLEDPLLWAAVQVALGHFDGAGRRYLAAHPDLHRIKPAEFGLGDFLQLGHVVVFNPAFEESGWHRNDEFQVAAVLRVHAAKPACKEIVPQFGAEPV